MAQESVTHFSEAKLKRECDQENAERKERIEHEGKLVFEVCIVPYALRNRVQSDICAVGSSYV